MLCLFSPDSHIPNTYTTWFNIHLPYVTIKPPNLDIDIETFKTTSERRTCKRLGLHKVIHLLIPRRNLDNHVKSVSTCTRARSTQALIKSLTVLWERERVRSQHKYPQVVAVEVHHITYLWFFNLFPFEPRFYEQGRQAANNNLHGSSPSNFRPFGYFCFMG